MKAAVIGLGEAGTLYCDRFRRPWLDGDGLRPGRQRHPGRSRPGRRRRRSGPTARISVLSLVGGKAAAAAATSVAPLLAGHRAVCGHERRRPGGEAADRAATVGCAPVRRRVGDRLGAGARCGDQRGDQRCRLGAGRAGVRRARRAGRGHRRAPRATPRARKLLRSTFMKGLGALIVESDRRRPGGRRRGRGCATQIADELVGGEAALDRLHDGTRQARRPAGDRDRRRRRPGSTRSGQRPVMTRAAAELHHAARRRRARPDRRPARPLRQARRGQHRRRPRPYGHARRRHPRTCGGEPGWSAGPAPCGSRPGDNQAIHRVLPQLPARRRARRQRQRRHHPRPDRRADRREGPGPRAWSA